MAFRITDAQRAAGLHVIHDGFRDDVLDHARRKVILAADLDIDEFHRIGCDLFDRVHVYLRNYETVTYESYVRMVIVYLIRGIDQVEGPDMQATLKNERFDINLRVSLAYEITKVFLRKFG